jgi:hypothetical protein
MKKTLSLVLALTLILSLAACGGGAAKPSAAAGAVAEEVKGITITDFSVTVNGVTIDQTAMADYPIYSVQASSTNSAGTESTKTYVGFAMSDVIKAAGLTGSYIWLEATADDGYAVTIKDDAVLAPTTLLALTEDGKPFASSPWLAPCASQTSGDYLKGCVSILVNTTEGAPEVSTAPASESAEPAPAGGLPEIQDKTGKVEFADFYFIVNGKGIINSKLKDLSIYKITVSVEDKSGTLSESTYTGYKLADVLKACGIESPTSVEVVASDGYVTDLASELITSEYTLVAIEKDKAVGEDGTIWIAPCSETSSKSYIKLAVGMNVK